MKIRNLNIALTVLAIATCGLAAAENPFAGRWGLTIPGKGAGWLEITEEEGYLDGSILWIGGSVTPVSSACMLEDDLAVTRVRTVERRDKNDKVVRRHRFTETFIIEKVGENLEITHNVPRPDGSGHEIDHATGVRLTPLPPKPDLLKVKFGEPTVLFNGKNLEGWKLLDPSHANGWSAEDGALVNNPGGHDEEHAVPYGNLRTVDEFEDFNLTLETNVEDDQNSGIYLRGIYEIQVAGSYGEEPTSHNMGAIYSRSVPKTNASKPPGQWQNFDITLVDRHVTVKLNGQTLFDNEPLYGCTGGALWADDLRPGPIYLQGDHSAVKYRNIVLRPVVK